MSEELTAEVMLLRITALRREYGWEMAARRRKLKRAYQRFTEFQQGHKIRMKMLAEIEADARAALSAVRASTKEA